MVPGDLTARLERIVGKAGVLSAPGELAVYGYDGGIEHAQPDVVVLPDSTEQVVAVMKLAVQAGVPVVPRGAGTGLSGGSIPLAGGIIVGTSRMRRILEINAEDRYAVCEPGVINLDISGAAAQYGLCYAPDPSSQTVSTLGGNVAEVKGLGKRKLAYPIQHFSEGYYVLLHFKLKSQASPELENRLNISEEIIRYLLKNME